ncbi:GtrA family protein [Lysobacter soli]|uniref:GtrA family protein n=1 Tax=Lysobacter soli TaxID=453783 RepID=UPI00367962B8
MRTRPDRSTLARQGGRYVVVGGVQLLVDWAVFVALSASGLLVEPANIVGRISGAAIGFWANGRFTFASDETAVGGRQFARFALMWLATTAISTWAVGHIDDAVGLRWTWLAKPAIDMTVAAIGFVLSRHWVYRR